MYARDYGQDEEYTQPRLASYLPSCVNCYVFSEMSWFYSYTFWLFVLVSLELYQAKVPIKIVAGEEGAICEQFLSSYSPAFPPYPTSAHNQTEIAEYSLWGCSCDSRILETLALAIILINRIYALYRVLVILIGCWICRRNGMSNNGGLVQVHSVLLLSTLVMSVLAYHLVGGNFIRVGTVDTIFLIWCCAQLVIQLYASWCSGPATAQSYREYVY